MADRPIPIEIIEGAAARARARPMANWGFNHRRKLELENESLKKKLRAHLFRPPRRAAAHRARTGGITFDSQIEAKDRNLGSPSALQCNAAVS